MMPCDHEFLQIEYCPRSDDDDLVTIWCSKCGIAIHFDSWNASNMTVYHIFVPHKQDFQDCPHTFGKTIIDNVSVCKVCAFTRQFKEMIK